MEREKESRTYDDLLDMYRRHRRLNTSIGTAAVVGVAGAGVVVGPRRHAVVGVRVALPGVAHRPIPGPDRPVADVPARASPHHPPPSSTAADGGGGQKEEEEMNPPQPRAGGPSCAVPKTSFLLVLLVVFLLLVWASPAPASALVPSVDRHRGGCNGSIAECRAEEEELLMDSEIHRRMLQGSPGRYISYGSVRTGDRPVCNAGQGNAYTNNCVPPRSNDHTRPCYTYYRCRSDTTGV